MAARSRPRRACIELAEETRRRTGELHILINNAGLTWGTAYEKFPWKAWERVLAVNVSGLFMLTRELMPMLIAAGTEAHPASVINLGSVMGTVTQSETAYSYSASKAAVHHLTRILAAEFAARHVNVNAIAPGPFPTNMTKFAIGDEAGLARAQSTVPSGRVGRADDMAGTVLYLTGRASAYTTGAIIPLDGGISVAAGPSMFEGGH